MMETVRRSAAEGIKSRERVKASNDRARRISWNPQLTVPGLPPFRAVMQLSGSQILSMVRNDLIS